MGESRWGLAVDAVLPPVEADAGRLGILRIFDTERSRSSVFDVPGMVDVSRERFDTGDPVYHGAGLSHAGGFHAGTGRSLLTAGSLKGRDQNARAKCSAQYRPTCTGN